MDTARIIGLIILFTFYGSYFLKAFMLSKSGIKTDRMGRGSKPRRTFVIEVVLKSTTSVAAGVQLISIVFADKLPLLIQFGWARSIGFAISLSGIAVFITAMAAMRDSWRAGIDNTQKTRMVKTGIYRYSRNPAFVGFDLFYIGMALAFSNGLNILFALALILLFHLQILEEEKFLPTVFGNEYFDYKRRTGRYFGGL